MNIFRWGGRKPSAHTPLVSKIPVFMRTAGSPFRRSLIKIALIAATFGFAVSCFGSPAIRVSSHWNAGAQHYQCTYLSALSGFETVTSSGFRGHCPLIAFFGVNITNILNLHIPHLQI